MASSKELTFPFPELDVPVDQNQRKNISSIFFHITRMQRLLPSSSHCRCTWKCQILFHSSCKSKTSFHSFKWPPPLVYIGVQSAWSPVLLELCPGSFSSTSRVLSHDSQLCRGHCSVPSTAFHSLELLAVSLVEGSFLLGPRRGWVFGAEPTSPQCLVLCSPFSTMHRWFQGSLIRCLVGEVERNENTGEKNT